MTHNPFLDHIVTKDNTDKISGANIINKMCKNIEKHNT